MISLLKQEVSQRDFENWLYTNPELENHLPPDEYLELISMNFNGKYAYEDIIIIIERIINVLEQERLKGLLEQLIHNKSEVVRLSEQIYNEYCFGYTFLRDLAIPFITTANHDEINIYGNEEQLLEMKVMLDHEAQSLIDCFMEKDIFLTGLYEYTDNRKEIKDNE
ncbi:hypothetical protein NNL21_00905 [Paenibacillus mendelii]|nr:hypothetical protein [Paenibacillus mendelii]